MDNFKQRVIFINRFFYPDHSATSQLLTDLSFHLASQNVDIEIITSRQKYDDASHELPAKETVNGVKINRIWTSRYGRQNLLGRALDYITFYGSALFYMLGHLRKGDYLVAKTDPPMLSIIAAICVYVKNAALINWTQDLFPEVAKALGIKGLSVIYPLLLRARNYSLKKAVMNVVIGEKMASCLLNQGVSRDQITVIPNWSIEDDIRPIDHSNNPFRKRWGLQEKFVVGYSGNIGRAHEFDTLISVAEVLQKHSHIRFLIVGGGAQYELIRQRMASLGLDNVMFQPYQAKEDLQYSLTVADLHVISLKPALEGLIVPSKFYGIAAAGRPVLFIGDTRGEIAQILAKEGCGQAFEIGEVNSVVDFIQTLAGDADLRAQMGQSARRVSELKYAKQHAFRAWESMLRMLED